MTNKTTFRWILSIIVVVVLLCIGVSWLVSDLFNDLEDYDEFQRNTQVIEMVLDLAQKYPTGSFPKDDAVSQELETRAQISYMMNDDKDCWHFLRKTMSENSNNYVTTAYRNMPADWRPGVDDSTVQVDFPDGTQAFMGFYQGTLVSCDTNQD